MTQHCCWLRQFPRFVGEKFGRLWGRVLPPVFGGFVSIGEKPLTGLSESDQESVDSTPE